MLKISLKYGLIAGVFLIIVFHVSSLLGLDPLLNLVYMIFDLLVFGIFVFFVMKEFKLAQENQVFHFWQGMTLGFNTYIIATLIFSSFFWLQLSFDATTLVDYQISARSFMMEHKDLYVEKMGDDQFTEKISEIDSVTPARLVFSVGLKKLLAGFFITPVLAVILRKQPN